MSSDFAAMLAAKRGNLIDPIKHPPKASAKEIPQAVMKTDPNTVRFFGPPMATIWFDGKNSGKKFGPDGSFMTPITSEIDQLSAMQNVRRG
jgi:hypothetical protein